MIIKILYTIIALRDGTFFNADGCDSIKEKVSVILLPIMAA
jgi:hypothetical protein